MRPPGPNQVQASTGRGREDGKSEGQVSMFEGLETRSRVYICPWQCQSVREQQARPSQDPTVLWPESEPGEVEMNFH